MSSILKVDTIQDQDGNNIINENANTITIGASGDTITIPAGATLANNGTATGFASIAWQAVTTAATLTTIAGKGYPINTTSNACTVTLPSSASVGDQVQLVDYAGTFATNNITLTSSLNIEGAADDKLLTTNREGVIITYVDATQGWVASSGVNSGTQALDPLPYDIDFLVIAGGGGSGSSKIGSGSGAGGGGGYRTSTQSVIGGTTYTVTVGDGGAGGTGTSGNVVGSNGSDSSISGSGLTTITSAGGGGGGHASGAAGTAGGSGGGGGGNSGATGAAGGAGNTPSTSPSQGNNGGTVTTGGGYGSGGGGAGGAGTNGGGSAGGVGTANSITGSSVTYSAGGSAGNNNPGSAGGANTGNGGQGSGQAYAGAAGGKGVVILSMPDASYSGTTTGSPTVATGVSGNTVLTFTGTGSYTA